MITKETVLISVTHASSEVGTIEPLKEIVKVAKEKNILIHTDAVAATGNIPVDVKDLGVDLLSIGCSSVLWPERGRGALYQTGTK